MDKFMIDGPMHPDLFNGESPTRMLVDYADLGLQVYMVECNFYVHEQQTHYVVADSEENANDLAWDLTVDSEGSALDNAEMEIMELDEQCHTWGGDKPLARELIQKHLDETRIDVR